MKVHFLGIGGSGTSAVAAIAQAQGFEVTGCDKEINNEFTKPFSKDQLFEGHSPDHIGSADILALTPAIYSLDPNNPELVAAKEKGIEVMTWQEFMGKYLEKDKTVIAICGTHGKSTTTALVASMMEDAGLDPTVELGAVIPKWGTNYRISADFRARIAMATPRDDVFASDQAKQSQGFFVTEADEFNDNFLVSHPDITVLTSVEYDHPEFFPDFESYKKSFLQFMYQTKKLIIANFQDAGVREVLEIFQKDKEKSNHPEIIDYSKSEILFSLKIPGEHNKLNAAAALQVGLALGIAPEKIQQSLQNFTGLSRRFELIGEKDGVKIYSDFAHNPGKIEAALKTVRGEYPDSKIWVIFQPHMFSRTKALFDEFVKVLKAAPVDKISITDIYPSREVDTGLVHSKQLAEVSGLEYLPKNDIFSEVEKNYQNFNVLMFVGAGDIDEIARKL
jgi:UDP-N-acetylmuramate--alanine ligase